MSAARTGKDAQEQTGDLVLFELPAAPPPITVEPWSGAESLSSSTI